MEAFIIVFEKPLSLLKDISGSVKGKRVKKGRVEPAQVVIKKGTYSDNDAVNPLMLRRLKSLEPSFLVIKSFIPISIASKCLLGNEFPAKLTA